MLDDQGGVIAASQRVVSKWHIYDNGKRLLYCTTPPPDSNQRASRGFKLKWGRAQVKFLQCFAALGFAVTYLFRHSRKSLFCAAYIRTVGNTWFEMRTFSFRKKKNLQCSDISIIFPGCGLCTARERSLSKIVMRVAESGLLATRTACHSWTLSQCSV